MTNSNVTTISDALDAFTQTERLTDGETTSQQSILELPEILFIRLNRFEFISGAACKSDKVLEHEHGRDLRVNGNRYRLFAIIRHIGDHPSSGHYTAKIKRNGQWLVCNDDTITLGSEAASGDNFVLVYQATQEEEEEAALVAQQPAADVLSASSKMQPWAIERKKLRMKERAQALSAINALAQSFLHRPGRPEMGLGRRKVQILQEMRKAVLSGQAVTKRAIYYRGQGE